MWRNVYFTFTYPMKLSSNCILSISIICKGFDRYKADINRKLLGIRTPYLC